MVLIKKSTFFALSIIYMLSLSACTKQEQPQPSSPGQRSIIPGHSNVQMPSAGQMKIVISDEIKGKWKGVVLTVMDKQTMSGTDYNVTIGSKFTISGSNIEVQTGTFLPDFQIADNVYSTASAELNNPAIQVEVTEGGKEIFKGWLFQKYPTVHPFKHERFFLSLKEPVSAL